MYKSRWNDRRNRAGSRNGKVNAEYDHADFAFARRPQVTFENLACAITIQKQTYSYVFSELTPETLKLIENGLIANGAEENPNGLDNLMKMLRALSENTTSSASTTSTTTTSTTTSTTTTTTTTIKPPKIIDQHPFRFEKDLFESEDIYHKSIMTMAEASIDVDDLSSRPIIPRSHYRKVEIDALEFEMEKSFYELKLAQLKYDRLRERISQSRVLWANDQLIESMQNDEMLENQSKEH